ncbi:hypothetical protein GWO43_30485, partial [candidate division KSB1 bacterium]|nr:hypothetical protein [candidate division KSB1 bacterium]NIR72801.1 hypothetical protein [candidate division KSB1 bacterium]NIS28220.1 hypothetical protein [candidate division KSB1 bacterium]NIT75111.1 hypothetical protein [candidate division KSB1 bacterium]NIU28898.1 hypothetical protein [candidate division KSB1 bacterium]
GELTFLPAGEACVTINKNLDGCLVLDRIAGQKRELTKSIQLSIKNGHVTHIKGNEDAERLRRNLRRFGKSGRAVAEIGVGTNGHVSFGASAHEDEKVLGTAHISLGQDQLTKVKGKMLQSVKGIILNPTICIDGRLIVDNGKMLV